jgi:hypothetical protein
MENATFVGCFQDYQRLHGLGVPNMDEWIDIDFSRSNNSQEWMLCNSRNLELVSLIEILSLFIRIIDHSDP